MNSSCYSCIWITLPTGKDDVFISIYGGSDECTEPEEAEDVNFSSFEQVVEELAFPSNPDSQSSVTTAAVTPFPPRLEFLFKIFVCLSVCLSSFSSSYKYFHYLFVRIRYILLYCEHISQKEHQQEWS